MVKLRRVESKEATICLEELGNVQELFGGRLGKVNADRKDADRVIKDLNKAFNSGKKKIDFDNSSPKDMFIIIGGFNHKDRDYKIQIYENYSDPKKKICVDLKTWTGKSLGSINGLILDSDKIISSLKKLMKINRINIDECVSTSLYKQWRDQKFKEQQIIALALQNMAHNKPPKPHRPPKPHGKPFDVKPEDPPATPDIAYNFGTLTDYASSRIDQDPYSTAWI